MRYLLTVIPSDVLGRVQGFLNFASYGGMPLGLVATGLALDRLGGRTTVLVFSAVLVVLALTPASAATCAPMTWQAGRRPSPEPVAYPHDTPCANLRRHGVPRSNGCSAVIGYGQRMMRAYAEAVNL